MGTESNQSSGNRNIPVSREDSREEARQHTGLFRWDDPENLMPSWSVPPGLIIPGPRQPDADAQPAGPGPRPGGPGPRPGGLGSPPADAGSPPTAAEPPAGRGSWPGVAPPAGWFLHSAQSPPAARQEPTSAQKPLGDQPGQRFALRVPAPAPAPDTGFPLSDTTASPPADSGKQPPVESGSGRGARPRGSRPPRGRSRRPA